MKGYDVKSMQGFYCDVRTPIQLSPQTEYWWKIVVKRPPYFTTGIKYSIESIEKLYDIKEDE